MTQVPQADTVKALLKTYPESYADALGIDMSSNTPQPLFQWLLVSMLFSARIGAGQALKAADALFERGWRTPQSMHDTTWEQRVEVLNSNGYARYDESTARYIADATDMLLERYGGDLRKLRTAAGRDPATERKLIMDFKGIGEVGADIFFRQAQIAWSEIYPFADAKARDAARKLGLPEDAKALAKLARKRQALPVLLEALVRADLDDRIKDIRSSA